MISHSVRGVHYSACSLYYKKIAQFHQKCSLMRDFSLFRRLLLPEYTVCICHTQSNVEVTVKQTVNQLYIYSTVLGAAIKCK